MNLGLCRGGSRSWKEKGHKQAKLYISGRGVPIIGSAKISANDMVIFTNIGIGTEQQEDLYRYRYYTVTLVCT